MKVNKVFPNSGFSTRFLSYETVVLLSILTFVVMYAFSGGNTPTWDSGKIWESVPDLTKGFYTSDSPTYFYAGTEILNGTLSLARTPVYPLVLVGLHALVGPTLMYPLLFLIQYLCFLWAAFILRRIALIFLESKKAAFWVTTVFLLLPSYVSFNLAVLTESFSISGVIVLIWLLVRRFPGCPSVNDCLLTGLLLIVLLYLRPVFLYLIPVVFVYYVLMIFRFKSKSYFPIGVGIAMLLVVIGSLAVYRNIIQSTYGIHSISSISVYNNNFTAFQSVGMHPELAPTDEMRSVLESIEREGYTNVKQQILAFGEYADAHPVEYETYVNRLLNVSTAACLKTVGTRIIDDVPKSRVIPNYFVPSYFVVDYFFFFSVYYAFIAWIIVVAVVYMIRTRKIPVITALLLMVTFGLTLASAIGAMEEWGRLTFPGFIAFVLLVAKLCTMYQYRHNSLKTLR